VDPSKKVPYLNCEVQDLLLEVVDLKQEVPDLRSGGIPHNLTPACVIHMVPWVSRVYTQRRLHNFVMVQLLYNSCAQIIHCIRQVAPLCTAT